MMVLMDTKLQVSSYDIAHLNLMAPTGLTNRSTVSIRVKLCNYIYVFKQTLKLLRNNLAGNITLFCKLLQLNINHH